MKKIFFFLLFLGVFFVFPKESLARGCPGGCRFPEDPWYCWEEVNYCCRYDDAVLVCDYNAGDCGTTYKEELCDGGDGPYCGDGSCNGGESCGTCGADCGACCTPVNPSTPVIYNPPSGKIFNPGQNIILDWSDVSWGNVCQSPSEKWYMIPYRFGAGAYTNKWSAASNYDISALAKCDGTYYWSVAAYNIKQGVDMVYSPTAPTRSFRYVGASAPSSTLTITPSAAATPSTISFNVVATDPDKNLSSANLYYLTTSGGKDVYTAIPGVPAKTCSGSCTPDPYTFTFSKAYACQAPADLKVVAWIRDTCGVGSTSNVASLSLGTSYSLTVNVKAIPALESGDLPECTSIATRPNLAGANVSIAGVGSATTNSSGVATIPNIPANLSPATLTVTYDNPAKVCDNSNLVCNGTLPVAGSMQVDFTGTPNCGTKNITVGVAEQLKTAWQTIVDGGVYANNIITPGECAAATIGGGFEPYLLNSLTQKGFARAINEISGDNVASGSEGGYAKKLTDKSKDVWFDNFQFPSTSELSGINSVSTFAALTENKVYKMTAEEFDSKQGNYDGVKDGAAIIYISNNKDISITKPMSSSNGGFLVVVTQGNVFVDKSLGVVNYTVPANFNTATPAQIRLGIISLKDVTFDAQTYPLIMEGFIMTRNAGKMTYLRDLGVNNSDYPALVLKYPSKSLYYLKNLELAISDSSGLGTYDVQWLYD